jgi:heme/copper-type cytochrome/quinol oxidase subunit 2
MQQASLNPPVSPRSLVGRWRWVILFLAAGLFILFVPFRLPTAAPVNRRIRIEASLSQFTPAVLQVNPGDRVTIDLVSTDVVHGFSLDGYNFTLAADPGQTVTGTFVANQQGEFRFRCLVPCGNLHPFMIGKLQVGTNLLLVRGIILGFLAAFVGAWFLCVGTYPFDAS